MLTKRHQELLNFINKKNLNYMAPVQPILNLVGFSAAFFIFYWTKHCGFKNQIQYLFDQKKLDTVELQADHFADFLLYYGIFNLILININLLINFITRNINSALNPQTSICVLIKKNIFASFEQFIIFSSLYIYLLQHKGNGLKVNNLVFLPFWFLIGRVVSFLQQLIELLIKQKFKLHYFGWMMTVFPIFLMLAQIFGYPLLSKI